MSVDALPSDLPVPVDDGACDHLAGMLVPALVLDSSQGPVDLRELGAGLAVLYVYPRTGIEANKSSIVDLERPDLSRFPLFAKATPTVFDLHPGETLFVPSGWWHTVKILSPSITISVNTANRPNWAAFVRDYVGSKRASRAPAYCSALNAYLVTLGWTEAALGSLTGWSQVL